MTRQGLNNGCTCPPIAESSAAADPEIAIGNRQISRRLPAFIVGEIGINHNGSVEDAKALIDAAHAAGVDAVKFQKRDLASIYASGVLDRLQDFEQGFQYLIPIIKDCELSAEQMAELKTYCDERGLIFLCTPFDVPSAQLLNELEVPAFKVSSADLTNSVLIDALASFGKPLLLSTGMSNPEEVARAAAQLRGAAAQFSLLHCVSSYPVDAKDARLSRISELIDSFQCPVGYSGHDIGIALSIAARTLGACIIEKHITLDRRRRGPDHKLSLEPKELKQLVQGIRDCEAAIYDTRKHLLPAEVLNQLVFRKSVVAAVPIKKGQTISREMLATKSPGCGLSVQDMNKLIGMASPRDLQIDEVFLPSDIDGTNGVGDPASFNWGKWGLVVRYHDFAQVVKYEPQCFEFHLTYNDTLLEVPHAELAKYRSELQKMTLRVHCCEYIGERLFDLCSTNPTIVELSREVLQRVIDITAELAPYFDGTTPMIVFNCGAMTLARDNARPRIDAEKFYSIIESLDLKGTHLLAQNMPPNPWYFGGQWKGHYFIEADELIAFCERTGHSLCLDLSHAYMSCKFKGYSFSSYIEKLSPYVKHIHVSDALSVEGEGVQIGEGEIDFKDFFRRYVSYQGTWVPEVWLGHSNGMRKARQALSRLESICCATLNGALKSKANGIHARNGIHANGLETESRPAGSRISPGPANASLDRADADPELAGRRF